MSQHTRLSRAIARVVAIVNAKQLATNPLPQQASPPSITLSTAEQAAVRQLALFIAMRLIQYYVRPRISMPPFHYIPDPPSILPDTPFFHALQKRCLPLLDLRADRAHSSVRTVYLLFHKHSTHLHFHWSILALFHVQLLFLFPCDFERIRGYLQHGEVVLAVERKSASEHARRAERARVASDFHLQDEAGDPAVSPLAHLLTWVPESSANDWDFWSKLLLRVLQRAPLSLPPHPHVMHLNTSKLDSDIPDHYVWSVTRAFRAWGTTVELGFYPSLYLSWTSEVVLFTSRSMETWEVLPWVKARAYVEFPRRHRGDASAAPLQEEVCARLAGDMLPAVRALDRRLVPQREIRAPESESVLVTRVSSGRGRESLRRRRRPSLSEDVFGNIGE